ncbi:pantoate--beta-alanine ligase [Actinomyces sp. HMSC075B09]|uniref:pantoate--beta-alanine ligase n=1 Tax=Actinomyces sp. HMSC075B09 TaxID=1739358 RepID=UPI0008A111E4|nr:pantoate--beta-alanine ligase [Actinomyces sp. HMSC075B09]OFJ61877.1 pantoate--beta-alanine ligase [Actinomyces sp. HMSC075B09]
MEPQVVKTREELRAALAKLPGRLGLVMTMGALHDGHLSLIKEAKKHADHVMVTVFVNPTQFAPGEDFDKYPRDLDADLKAVAKVGADLVFAPAANEMYPGEASVTINPGPTATVLEGKTRPTHFAGVLLVVHKMFNLTGADVAVFGQKDAQQLALIRQMVRDLDMPVQIVGAPIVRGDDGLALSSRNAYLSDAEHQQALSLSGALKAGKQASNSGASASQIKQAARCVLENADVKIDYVELVEPTTFQSVEAGEAVLALAAYVGNTRLIDNTILNIGEASNG